MKKKTIISCFAIVATFLLFTFPMKLYALNYTISFTGTGASTSVESVVVQNLTKRTTVTVPTGNVLNLTDVATTVDNINAGAENISVYPNPMQEKSTISFFSKSAGIAQINVFSLDGKKIISVSRNISQGNSSFQLLLPKGAYTIQVQGNGFSYSAKVISQINSNCKAQIVFSDNENNIKSKPQKSKSAVTTLLYTAGDQLLYKGKSGNYTAIVTDVPTGSKATNFDFVECKDLEGNYYATVKIGGQLWMAENLKAIRYRNYEYIPSTPWNYTTTGLWCDFNNDPNLGILNGHMYNWYAATDVRNIAPVGWHVPSNDEWTTLANSLGGANVAGTKMKETGTTHWYSPNIYSTNESGFSALPGSMRGGDGTFGDYQNGYYKLVNWWSTTSTHYTNAGCIQVAFNYPDLFISTTQRTNGCYIRCIKD